MSEDRLNLFSTVTEFIHELYGTNDFIPLHVPYFLGNEKKYLNECIDSTFVSSVGKYVDEFENKVADYTGAKYAIAAVNGTSALHIALLLAGVGEGDEVIIQSLSFVATANAVSYTGARPVFIDVDRDTLGMSANSLERFLADNTVLENGQVLNKRSGRVIKACVPMHTFGHPCRIDRIHEICEHYGIALVEDSAESIGSFYKQKHTGTFGKLGVFSFNGNKTITTGGGGMIVTDDKLLAEKAKHLTTTAKVPHKWEYVHDMVGYNYRLTNINAALGVAQMEQLATFLASKRETASIYKDFFGNLKIDFLKEPNGAESNYWLNAVILKDRDERDAFLAYTNENGVMTRPLWRLLNRLDMYKDCECDSLENATWLEERVVNIPSSYRIAHR